MIRIVGTALYQWDAGRYVTTDIEADHIHFSNKGDSKAVIMELADSQAKIPDYLLQTGKQLCVYVVRNGITVESVVFSVNQRERPESYVYDEDQRNFVYALIASAEAATNAAKQAAEVAAKAGQNAGKSANRANVAAKAAEKASNDANKAAVSASQAAKSLMVVGEAKGTVIALDDAIKQNLVGLRVFGKTTQDGTPTPDAPVELVSIGDSGSITVNVNGENEAQSMTIATPNGLPGIPVTSGGNYTDASGQQWICDEIDFARGVYVQRIGKVDLGMLSWKLLKDSIFYSSDNTMPAGNGRDINTDLLCSIYAPDKKAQDWQYVSNNCVLLRKSVDLVDFYSVCLKDTRHNTVSEFKNAVLGVRLYRVLATPIETPLFEEELAAYANLHTYKDHTTVSNDAGAYMELEYVMDARKYIDNMILGTIFPATVE